jgi:tetratricopeptide (TPR) repeat protein
MPEQELDSNHMYRAWSFMKEGKQVEAFIEAKNVSSSDPFFYDAKILCGEIKTSMKHYETAEQYLNEAIALKPDIPTAYMRRAWLRCSQKQPDLGLNDINKAETLIELLDNSLVDDWIIQQISLHHHNFWC